MHVKSSKTNLHTSTLQQADHDPLTVLAAPPERLTVHQYQRLALTTDRTAGNGPKGLDFPLLGLFGESGSLLSELKKKQRDADSYFGYEASVVEELGDVLWYFSNLASRAGIQLGELATRIAGTAPSEANSITFAALQPSLVTSGPTTQSTFEATLMRLAGEVGKLVADYSAGGITPGAGILLAHIADIFTALISAANEAGVSLADAAHRNLRKTYDRWPPAPRSYPPLFDESVDPGEQLPRRIEMHIFEKTVNKKTYVFLRCNGINIGDRLTDNKLEKDDYRFHDVFHLAYAAILGWSPVTRALFRVKRKSRPEIDEAEDGARAILIEEGLSTWIFNHALALKYYANLNVVDYGLLKAVRALVKGYEAERCPLWLWEQAILQGYNVFRQLQKNRRGIVIADLTNRTITFEKMSS